MEYRSMEKLGVAPSLLGFGCMRFPTTADGKIDEPEAQRMLDRAIEAGVTYLDTAYPYHGGQSEGVVGRAIKRYDRSKLLLATKLPLWAVNSVADAERIFAEQLERLQTTYIDFYLLHAVNRDSFDKMVEYGVVEKMEQYKKEGKIRFLGFSFHDNYDAFAHVLGYRDWDFCQIQLNYMDTDEQAGLKGYALAEQHGVPLVIMEPAKGGSLTGFADDIRARFLAAEPNRSIASWAFRWVATLPNVKVVLSGMSTMEQVEDNLATFGAFQPLDNASLALVEDIANEVRARVKNGCTHCRYCMPCPFGIEIPRNFALWNEYGMYQNKGAANWKYYHELKEEQRASACKQCGACESKCPQKLPIRAQLAAMADELAALQQ